MDFLIPVIILSILIILNGVFVAAEFAIVASSKTRVEKLAQGGSPIAKNLLEIFNDPNLQNRFIATAQVGITIASLGLGMYGELILAEWFLVFFKNLRSLAEPLAHTMATITAVGLLTYFHVVIGEMIPKSIALQSPEKTALFLGRIMAWLEKLFYPVVWILNKTALLITKLLRIDILDNSSRVFTSYELEYIVKESSFSGLLEQSDKLFVENILDLQARTLEDVMTPRNHVFGIPASSGAETVIELVCKSKKTRYPIYKEDLDQITGILHIKDIARYQANQADDNFNLHEFSRPTTFIPESKSLDKVLAQFRLDQLQIAIVIDEFGGTAGIVTLEDILEEVVGEILDEFDQETIPIEVISNNILKVRGDVILDELNQLHALGIMHSDAHTIGGLAVMLLGHIPKPGEKVKYQNIVIEIDKVDKLAVTSVLLHHNQHMAA